MTLIFSGNDCKYEIEGVMKLFIPAARFKHIFADSFAADDDHALIGVREEQDSVLLFLFAAFHTRTTPWEKRVPQG